jgi:hypothetical protein
LAVTLTSCAPATSGKTIEPTIEPKGQGDSSDTAFLLSRDPKAVKTSPLRADFPIHIEEKWWPFRAEYLGITIAEAQSRDGNISARTPPQNFWDEQTAIEAVSIWSALCNECHGGRRKLKDGIEMPPPPAGWGAGEGLFFGRSRPYAEIFRLIYEGGPERDGKPSEMPAWGRRLGREQIWSLIYFIWYQSGGVKGQFPPSLYPRPPEEIR